MNITVKGIIISETDFSEHDKYITLLTYDHGKISVLCRGVRRKNAPLANKTRLFAFAEFELFTNKNRYILNDVLLIERFFEITEDIEHFAICSYFVQLASKLCDEDHVNIEVTRTLISSLYAVAKQKKTPKLVKCALELRLIAHSGFHPVIDRCGICDKKSGLAQPYFDTINGCICCSECLIDINSPHVMPITQGVLHAMYHILTCDLDKLYSFNLGERGFNILYNLCEDFVLTQTDYKFKTLDFYKSIGG
ncbi:MAG: DNA repair protein RecO [Clostridia bacterium]